MSLALLTSDNPLKVEVKSTENSFAILELPDKQSFRVSLKYLPKNAKKGDILYLNLVNEDQLSLAKKETAKAILEEILG